MPIYEYRCEECGAVSEVLVRNTQRPVEVVCSTCESTKVSRIISIPGAVMTKSSAPSCGVDASAGCPHAHHCGTGDAQCPAAGMHHH